MGLNITDEEYNGLPSLYANAGEWVSATIDVGNFYSAGSGTGNTFTAFGGNALAIQNGVWADFGFTEGMVLNFQFTDYTIPPPFNPLTASATITYINGNILYLSANWGTYNNTVFPTTNQVSGMLAYADVSPDALEMYFNLSPNNSASVNSVLDGQVNRFEIQNLGSLAVSATAPMLQVNNQSGGWMRNVQITRNADTPPLQFGGTTNPIQRNYTIDFEFIQWGLLQDGIDPPSYYNAADCLTPFIQVDTYGIYADPNSIQSTENAAQQANTGYFDENYNGGVSSYISQSIAWTDLNGDPIDKMDYSNFSDFTAVITAPNQDTVSSIYRIGLAFLPADTAQYQNLPTDAGDNLLINAPDVDFNHSVSPSPTVYTGETNSAGARFDLTNLQFEIVGGTVEVSGRVIPENASNETIDYFSQFPDGERRMVIWVQVGDYTLTNQNSDQVNVLIFNDDNYDAPTLNVQIPTVVSETLYDHDLNDITLIVNGNTTTEDDVLYVSEFTLPTGTEYEGVRAGIYAYNTVTGEQFTLEEYFMSFANQPFVAGIHEVNFDIARNFLLAPTTDRNSITLQRKPSLDGGGQYGLELNYGYLNDWRYWLEQANANPDFFNAAESFNGLNKDWQHYDLFPAGDWIIRLSYFTRLQGVDDFNHYQFRIRPYEDTPTINFSRTFTVLSTGQTPNQLIANELIQIDAVWEWTTGQYDQEWAEITVENYEGARIGYISSVLPHGNIASNALQPLPSQPQMQLTISPANTATGSCLIDTNLVNVNEVSLTYRIYSAPKGQDFEYMVWETDVAYVAYGFIKLSPNSVYPDASPCITVYRQGDGATLDVGFVAAPSGQLVLDTVAMLNFVNEFGADNGLIQRFYDQGGLGNDATQFTDADMAVIVNAGTLVVDSNGNPAAVFNGVSQFYNLTNPVNNTQRYLMISSFGRAAGLGIKSMMLADPAASPYVAYIDGSDNILSYMGAASENHGTTTEKKEIILSTLRNTSDDIKLWIDNTQKTTRNSAAAVNALTTLGQSGGADYHNGLFTTCIQYTSDFESFRQGLVNTLNNYYNYI